MTDNERFATVSRPWKTGRPSGLPESGDGFDGWRAVFVNPAGGTGAATGRSYAICEQAADNDNDPGWW